MGLGDASEKMDTEKNKSLNDRYIPNCKESSGKESREATGEIQNGRQVPMVSQPYIKKPGRTLVIEPAMALFFMFHLSSYTLFVQYVYFSIGEKYNLSDKMTAEGNNNNSNDGEEDQGGGCCISNEGQNNSVYLLQQKVQAEAATMTVFLEMSALIPALFTTLFFGTLTDRFGRKPGLIVPLIGMSIKVFVPILQILLDLPLEFIILGHIMDGLLGGYGAFATSCYSYLADTIRPENLGKRMTIAEVAFALCLAVMSIVIGVTIKELGFLPPFAMILVGHGFNMVYVLLCVPETVNRKGSGQREKLSPMYVLQSFKVLTAKRPDGGRRLLLVYFFALVLCGFSTFPRYNIESLYKLNSPFCWNSLHIGVFMAITTLVTGITEVVVAVFFLKRWGELLWTKISLLSLIVTYIVEAFSTTSWMLMLLPFTGLFSGLQPAVMRSTLSKLVTSKEQGALFAMNMAVDNVVYNISAVVYNLIYASTLLFFKGTVFLLMAFFVVLALVIVSIFGVLQEKQKQMKEDKIIQEGYSLSVKF